MDSKQNSPLRVKGDEVPTLVIDRESLPHPGCQAMATPATGDRRAQNVAVIKQILEDRRCNPGEATSQEEMAENDSAHRVIALKHGLLANIEALAKANAGIAACIECLAR